MQPGQHSQRQGRDGQQVADRGLRVGCRAAKQLRKRGDLRDDRGGHLQRENEKPQAKAEGEANHNLNRCGQQRALNPGHAVRHRRGDDRSKGQRQHQTNALRHCLITKGRHQEQRGTDPQKNQRRRPQPGLADARNRGQLRVNLVHAGTTPIRAGRASMPISS